MNILAGVEGLAAECPIIFPVHPRTRRRIEDFSLRSQLEMARGKGTNHAHGPQRGIVTTDPLGYLDFLCLMKHATLVLTDSGGIQEETTCLGIPCVTLRDNTERPVTVENGTNTIAGRTKEGIREAISRQMTRKPSERVPEKWDGRAATRIVDVLIRAQEERASTGLLAR